jgi:plastocyanin
MILFIPTSYIKFATAPVLALAALAAGCDRNSLSAGASASPGFVSLSAATQPAPKIPEVAIDNFSFNPPTLTVAAGTTVTWVNHDDIPHTVTANDRGFDSKALDTDERFSHAFTAPGTYAYYCAVHPHMVGRIIVK